MSDSGFGFGFIVGTAGHIDHGKSALVRALTGTDPDRLKEEQERGITIDLGFAHLDLPGGKRLSFIDVPGHERFVRNMLAGAHGIDAVLLVVAADESVMPQTREHFHICRLLGVRRGLLALTKCDLADPDSQALSELELRELVAGTFLEEAPLVRTSARTGAGLDALSRELEALLKGADPRPADGPLRLPVDRVFTLKGFGTVVTGTLIAGRLAVGDEIEVCPAGHPARVRGLQVHGAAVQEAAAGHRTAVNLAGLDLADVSRGDVLGRPGNLCPTSLLDVEIALLSGGRPLKDQARVRVHVASAEVLARVRLLGIHEAPDGATVPAQLRLERPVVAARGDRLILRSYSPAVTIGGAVLLDPLPPKRRAADRPAVVRAAELDVGDIRTAAVLMVREAGARGVGAGILAARLGLSSEGLRGVLAEAPEVVAPSGEGGAYLARKVLGELGQATLRRLERYHREQPLREALGREELKSSLFGATPAGTFERVLADLSTAGKVRVRPDAVALARHSVTLSPGDETARATVLDQAREAAFRGLEQARIVELCAGDRGVAERVSRLLLSDGSLQRVGETLLLHRERLDDLKHEVRRRWPPGSRLDVAALKELTGLSRKYVIPLLEYLDRERVTRRSGNDRVVLSAAPAVSS